MPETSCTSSRPQVALVCDWLTTPGGAEKLLLELHNLYPEAPIYTSQHRPKKLNWFNDATVKTGWMQFLPAALRRILGPLRQIYFSHLDLSEYDLVISVTGAEAKSVKTRHSSEEKSGAFHLCYCHAPTQYYWEMYDSYLENPGFGILNPIVRAFFKLFVKPLRRADFRAAQRPDAFVTISSSSAAQIEKYYHRASSIIAPPVDVAKFRPRSFASAEKSARERSSKSASSKNSAAPVYENSSGSIAASAPYFVIACRQVTWKRIDLAIKACLKLKKPLYVIGDGAEHERLKAMAGGSSLVTFLPWLEASELAHYLENASAYLFPSLEPFGIAAVEALAAGCPVIAYAAGGSRDFVRPGRNGLLFSEQTVDSLAAAIADFRPEAFDRETVSASADEFSPAHFREKFTAIVRKSLSPRENSSASGRPKSRPKGHPKSRSKPRRQKGNFENV